jgi:hypothetical protein
MGRASRAAMTLAPAVLMVITSAIGWCLTKNPDLQGCSYSNEVYDGDQLLQQLRAPTRFRLMSSRYVEIVQAARGSACTHTTAVAFTGHNYIQAGMSDDPGMAELIPIIAHLTGTSLASAFDLTVLSVICLGSLIGYAGFWQMFSNQQVRWLGAAIFLCLGLAQARAADVYVFQTSPLIAGIPWVLHFALTRNSFALNLSAAVLAFVCSWSSLVRIGTTTVCLAFLLTLFLCWRPSRKTFLRLLIVLVAGGPALLFQHNLTRHRDEILARFGATATAVEKHPVWHSIYVGLGFVPNSEVPRFSDTVAMDRARSVDPTVVYTSARYESILRSEVLRIARHRPLVVVENLAAKGGIVMLLALILLFPSRRLLFREPDVLWLDAAFAAAIVVSSMNAILVAPKPVYLLTFLCLTFLYSAIKLCRSLSMQRDPIASLFRNHLSGVVRRK